MKKIIARIALVFLFIVYLILLFEPFYTEVEKNGIKGFFTALIKYLIIFGIAYLVFKIINWCINNI